jgi:hydroxymethylpyrimidine/phosphomethylpyrimidine kinase
MLFSKEIIEGVGEILEKLDIPVIFDPVFISKVGSPLLQDDAVDAMKKLFKYATLITPNMHEDESTYKALYDAPCPVLVKHQVINDENEEKSADILFYKDKMQLFTSNMLETTNLHGTGCSYSSAITANIALGETLENAIKISKDFIYEAIKNAPNIGHGAGPINHKIGGSNVKK